MAREVFTRLLWTAIGIFALCIAIGVLRTLSELAFPTYSGFRFYQPLRAIPGHILISFLGMGIAQLVAWACNLAAIQSWSGNLLLGGGYSGATFAAFSAEKHLPSWLGSPGSTHSLFSLLALGLALCVALRLVFSMWLQRRHT